jgi:polysaccharide export outer membrane protein
MLYTMRILINKNCHLLPSKYKKSYLLSLMFLAIMVMSCARHDKLLYLNTEDFNVSNPLYTEYVLKPNDALYIRIVSADERVNNLFKPVAEDRIYNVSESNLYLFSYLISNDSMIALPIIGKINAAGLTVIDFESKLQEAVNEVVNEAFVTVRLVNYNVTVIGEVARPGTIPIYQPNSTIFDVLAKAGDILNSGNRNEISVLREEDNVLTKYKIDLGSIDAIKSPVYYSYPNDVIIVKPLKYKTIRENIPLYSLLLSTITTFLLVLNVINKK